MSVNKYFFYRSMKMLASPGVNNLSSVFKELVVIGFDRRYSLTKCKAEMRVSDLSSSTFSVFLSKVSRKPAG